MPHPLPDPELLPEFYAWVPAKRLAAWAVDTVLILLLFVVVLVLTALTGLLIMPLLLFAVNLAYRAVSIGRWSATPGMMLMAIEFRRLSGQRLDPMQAFVHSLVFCIAQLVPVLLLISAALMLLTPRGQGLSDHLLHTTALNRPAPH
ncbi:RDD family protein [Alkalilacustris brevis]|uniref:RDD family protein n=1 Tax=Alkalilacustris brevis TaxID=2026338 RepID=UPI000E0D3DD4|nr:RDD family protein [Alkalilacustris brevis]